MTIDCPSRPEQVCFAAGAHVADGIDLLAWQYRNSPNLKAYLSLMLAELEVLREAACNVAFDIDTSTGAALTMIGKFVGFPRCHCAVFPPDCCPQFTFGEDYCFDDDELYRKLIKAWLVRRKSTGLVTELQDSAQALFGVDTRVMTYAFGDITVGTGRSLTALEHALLPFIETRVLPTGFGCHAVVVETTDTSLITC